MDGIKNMNKLIYKSKPFIFHLPAAWYTEDNKISIPEKHKNLSLSHKWIDSR
jgi:hypothetical protein